MANLTESAVWETGIYQFETSDPVMGGPDGIDNLQAKQLANRTAYLKQQVESAQGELTGHAVAADPHPQYMTPVEGDGRYLGLGGGTMTGPLWLSGNGLKQVNAAGNGDLEIVHRGNGGVSVYVDNGVNRVARFTQAGRMLLSGAVDNARDALQVPGTVCAASPADGADNDQLPPTAWVNRRIAAVVANLVSSSPAALDTLNELAAALGNDPNFATTITNALGAKASKSTSLAGYGILDALTHIASGQPLPSQNIGPVWHDDYNSLMTWQVFNANGAAYTGYASVLVGSLLADTQPMPRAGYVKSGVQNLSRTTYAALRGWAMHNGVMVALGTWAAGGIAVADNADGTTFRAYDVRGEFPRFWDDGRGVDTGRAFGSRQRGSLAVGDDGNNTAALRFDNEGLSARYGYDTPTLAQLNADYPNRMFLGVNTNTSGDGGYNADPNYWGISRPRNVALQAAIKF